MDAYFLHDVRNYLFEPRAYDIAHMNAILKMRSEFLISLLWFVQNRKCYCICMFSGRALKKECIKRRFHVDCVWMHSIILYCVAAL